MLNIITFNQAQDIVITVIKTEPGRCLETLNITTSPGDKLQVLFVLPLYSLLETVCVYG